MTNEKNRLGISRSNPSNPASEHVRGQAAVMDWGGWGRKAELLGEGKQSCWEKSCWSCPISLLGKKGSQGNVVAAAFGSFTFGTKAWWWPLCKVGVLK